MIRHYKLNYLNKADNLSKKFQADTEHNNHRNGLHIDKAPLIVMVWQSSNIKINNSKIKRN